MRDFRNSNASPGGQRQSTTPDPQKRILLGNLQGKKRGNNSPHADHALGNKLASLRKINNQPPAQNVPDSKEVVKTPALKLFTKNLVQSL